MKAFLSVFIFALVYLVIASDKVNKTIVAVIGASVILFLKLVTFEQAMAAVDLNVVFLLVGMMTGVYILSKTGFFEWLAIVVAKIAKGDPWIILLLLLTVTCVISAFLDNVTTVILIVPVTILIMQILEISPVPFIILEAIVSNIGGTATLIGDPPNIVIGSKAHLSFNDFLVHLSPAIVIIYACFIVSVYFIFRKRFNVPDDIKKRVREAIPNLAIVDKTNMIKSLVIFALIFVGFLFQNAMNVEPGIIALFGSMIMLLVCRVENEDLLLGVEWGVVFFFIGMFMIVSALQVNGVISWVGAKILHFSGDNLFFVCLVVLWGSAIFSSLLDNIPFVITMVPLIQQFVIYFSGTMGITDHAMITKTISYPLWWSLALGACLGGNGTLIGASANIVSARIGERNNYPISFMKFLKYGSFFTLQSIIISSIYIWIRYFIF